MSSATGTLAATRRTGNARLAQPLAVLAVIGVVAANIVEAPHHILT